MLRDAALLALLVLAILVLTLFPPLGLPLWLDGLLWLASAFLGKVAGDLTRRLCCGSR